MRESAADSLQIAAKAIFDSIVGCYQRRPMMDQEGAI
jgi:hypothetical protein